MLLAVGVLLAPAIPAEEASTSSQVELAFTSHDGYELSAQVLHAGQDAVAYRERWDADGDERITPEEHSRAKAMLQAAMEDEERSNHRLDSHAPYEVQVHWMRLNGFEGAVDRSEPVELNLSITYDYALPAASQRTLFIDREASEESTLEVRILGPRGWTLQNTTGFETQASNLTTGDDEGTGRAWLEATPPGAYGVRFEHPNRPSSEPASDAEGETPAPENETTTPPSNETTPAPDPAPTDPGPPEPATRPAPIPWPITLLATAAAAALVAARP